MRTFSKSSKLDNVCYDIRGPVMDEANEMIAKGEKIFKLNIGNPAPFAFNAPDEIIQAMTDNLRNAQGYSDSKGITEARQAIYDYAHFKGIPVESLNDIYTGNGVSELITMVMQGLLNNGDEVLVPAPDYPLWTASVTLAGGTAVHYICDESSEWYPDLEDMEKKIVENHIHAAIFCSPHNPCGRVWERWEIEQAMALYKKYDVMVVSDEIWSDILLTGYRHIPTQSVSEDAKMRTVALYAPSKTFNLAGLVGSYHIIYNSWLRDRCDKEGSLSHYNAMNVMSMHALLGAYRPEGYEWVEELRQVITGNVDFACDYIAKHFNGVDVSRPQGTYMLFLDCGEWLTAHGKTDPHPHEPRAAPEPGAGGLPAAGYLCFQCLIRYSGADYRPGAFALRDKIRHFT